jgi:hypothetical protein
MLREPLDHPQNESFFEAGGNVFAEADRTEGYLWGADPAEDYVWPNFAGDQETRVVQTLTLWRDLDCVRNFAYHGAHLGALRRRSDWVTRGSWPTFVAWWHPDDAYPTWGEASKRLERLHEHGPTPDGFTFNAAFDQKGQALAARSKPWAGLVGQPNLPS